MMLLRISSAAFASLPVLVSLSSAASAAPRKPTHVACVGDSITVGVGASVRSNNYVTLLQAALGNEVEVRNFGNSGSTMLTAPEGNKPYREQTEFTEATEFVDSAPADAVVSVVIVLGANDSKPMNWDGNAQEYLKDYGEFVDHFLNLSSKPTVYAAYPLATGDNQCCQIRGEIIAAEQIPLIKQVATDKRIPIIDLNTGTTGHPEYFADGVHPNDEGYAVMANLVEIGLAREPSVTLTSPAAAAMVDAGMVQLAAETSDETVDLVSVEFFEGELSLGTATQAPFVLDWPAPAGDHTVTAKATDSTGATGLSLGVTFSVVESPDGAGGSGGAANTGGSGGTGGVDGSDGTAGMGGSASGGVAAGGAATPAEPSALAPAAGAPTTNPPLGGQPSEPEASSSSGCSLSPRRPSPMNLSLLLLAGLLMRRKRRR